MGLSLYASAKLLQVVELCNTLLEFLTLPLTPPFYGRGWGRLLFGVKVSFQYIQEVLLVDDPVEGGDESVFGVSPVQELRADCLAAGLEENVLAIGVADLPKSLYSLFCHHAQRLDVAFVVLDQLIPPRHEFLFYHL